MTAGGVIPTPEERGDGCPLCRGTGWTTVVDGDGDAYAINCPNGCPTAYPVQAIDPPY